MSKQPQKENRVKVTPAKGRPMLSWVGKKPLDYVKGFPAQALEIFDPLKTGLRYEIPKYDNLAKNWQNLLFYGDNKDVLATLLEQGFRGKIDLIYIDPPFNTGVNYVRQAHLRGLKDIEKLEGEGYGIEEQLMYFNNFADDAYLQWMYEKFQLLKELLAETGAIFVRMDYHFGHYIKSILDEIFGKDNFQNEFIVNRIKKNVTVKGRRTIPNAVDNLFAYFKSINAEYKDINKSLKSMKAGYWHAMESQGIPGPRQTVIEGNTYHPSPGTHFKFTQKQLDEMYTGGKIRVNPNSKRPEYWVEPKDYETLDTNWTDIPGYTFTTDYPTENAEKLLTRVLNVASKPDDLVLDCFIGSGTTAAVAQKLGRRWIGCDINKGAIQTTSKRLQNIILEQIKGKRRDSSAELALERSEGPQNDKKGSSFATYKVNNYDLQLLRTEAIELAVQHIGIQRTKTDAFFDGTLSRKLVKIIEFNHPFTLLDWQLLQDELKKRPEEDRNIVVVCLGKELAVDPEIEKWNKTRPYKNAKIKERINLIEVIELKTDKKYGNFLIHKPDEAKVGIIRSAQNDKVATITIQNFISPTIIERLNIDNTLFKTKIPDFRAMIDCILIDTDYDGKVFHIIHSDVPEKKSDLIVGKYEVEIPKKKTTVAVKIVDMLGEELIITKKV